MMHGTINSTLLTKTKNEILEDIEKNRQYTKTAYPDANLRLVDMVYDREREAVVSFYFKLLERI